MGKLQISGAIKFTKPLPEQPKPWTPSIFGPNPMNREKKLAAKQRKRLAKLRRKQGR